MDGGRWGARNGSEGGATEAKRSTASASTHEEPPDDELWDKLSPCSGPQMLTREEKAEEDKNKDVIVRKGLWGVLCTTPQSTNPQPRPPRPYTNGMVHTFHSTTLPMPPSHPTPMHSKPLKPKHNTHTHTSDQNLIPIPIPSPSPSPSHPPPNPPPHPDPASPAPLASRTSIIVTCKEHTLNIMHMGIWVAWHRSCSSNAHKKDYNYCF